MKVDVIGGNDHTGAYLITHLVETSHDVINIGCGKRYPYHPHLAWLQMQSIAVDRDTESKTDILGAQFENCAMKRSSVTNIVG